MHSKSKCLPPGTSVLLSGLERNLTLNHNRGETLGSFDGSRYAVKLSNGSVVRVTPDKLAPTCPMGFADYVQRFTDELCVFAHHYSDQPSSLFPVKATTLGARCKVLSERTVRIALSSTTKLLYLYESASELPYMQLKPLQTVPNGDTIQLAVMLYDSPTIVPADVDCNAQYIMLSCRGSTLFFENQMPIFHMSMTHMLSYMTDRMTACLVDNYFEIVRYMRGVDDLEDTTYDPSSRSLLFKLKSSNARGKIVCPMQKCDVFAVARHGHMTEYRISFLGKASSFVRPSHAIYMFPIGSVVNHNDKKFVVGELGLEDTSNLLPSVGTFLQSQLVLAAHFVKYGLVSRQLISTQIRRHMDGIITLICEMVCENSQHEMAQSAQKIMMANVSDGTHFLLCPDFMDSVFKDEDRLVAWVANLEALLNAFTVVFDSTNPVLSLDDGLFKVTTETSMVLYVASFANDPIENQAWIFQRELSSISEATQTASLQQTIQRLASVSTDMSWNVGSAISQVITQLFDGALSTEKDSSSETPASGKKRLCKPEKVEAIDDAIDDATIRKCLERQQALIDEEEADKAITTVAEAKKRKKKKKKKANATVIDRAGSPRSVESRDALLIEDEAATVSSRSSPFVEPPSEDLLGDGLSLIDGCPDDAKDGDATQSPASTSSSASAAALSDAIAVLGDVSEVNAPTSEPFRVMNTRANVRIEKMKKALTEARDRIHELETTCAGLQSELNKERASGDLDARRIDRLTRDLNAQSDSIAESNARHALTMRALTATHVAEIAHLESELVSRTKTYDQMVTRLAACDDRLSKMTQTHKTMSLESDCLQLRVENHSRMLLLKLAGQIRHYLKGHYMKLDKDTLSIPAMLRDGYAAIMLVDLYGNLVGEKQAEEIVHLAISTTLDMRATDSAGITWMSQ